MGAVHPKIRKLARQVEPKWQDSFLVFVDTGEAPADFINHLDKCPSCQEAVEAALDFKVKGLEKLREVLHSISSRKA